MEGTSQSTDGTSNSLIKINEIVNENLQRTWRLQAQVKYLKIECENLDKEIKDLKPKIEVEMDTFKSLEENLQRALKIKESEMQAIDVATKTHPQLVQRKIDENLKLKEWQNIYQSTYDEYVVKYEQFKKNVEDRNPLLREIRAENAEINKLEFNMKFLNEKIKNAKRAQELKKEIYQKISNATVLQFVQAVSKYYYRESVMNQLRENEVLMENQQQQYKRKDIEKERKRVLDNISKKIEIPNINVQLLDNLMGSIYQSVLPEIRLPRSRQNYKMPEADISNILTKYKKRSEEQNEMARKVDHFKLKQSNYVNSNEIQRKNVRAFKRSFEDDQLTKQVKKPFEPQRNIITEPKICNKTKPPGIMKRNLGKENINQHVTSSQKCVTKQVIFKMKDSSPAERSSVNDKTITSDKSQEKLAQSQSNKAKLTPNVKDVSSANFSFVLSSQGSQTQKNTKQITKVQTKEDLKFPAAMSSFGFIPREKNTRANKQPEQKIIKNKSMENPERKNSISKPPNFSAGMDQNDEFSPYFKETESSRRESQPDKSNINEEQEKAKNIVTNTITDMAECENEAGQYLSNEFLTPQEDELGDTPNITFLGEDPLTDGSREEQDGFLFNLGHFNSQSSFKPFNFLN